MLDPRLADRADLSVVALVLDRPDLYPVDGRYVERYWLPTLGPSATWALRRLGLLAAGAVAGPPISVPLAALSAELGLGPSAGRCAKVRGSLDRLLRFHVADFDGDLLRVCPRVPPLSAGAVRRLPSHLQERHPHA